jgi:hypothetical protein
MDFSAFSEWVKQQSEKIQKMLAEAQKGLPRKPN